MPIVPPGFVECQVFGSNTAGRTWLIACAFDAVDVGQDDAEDAAAAVGASDYVDDVMASSFTAEGLRLRVGTSDPSAPVVFEASIPGGQGGGGEGAVPSAAFLVTKGTSLGGRKGRGRTFFPGPTEAQVDDNGLIVGDLVTNSSPLTGFWGLVRAAIGSSAAYLLHTDPGDDPTEVTSFSLASRVATQRRRLRG